MIDIVFPKDNEKEFIKIAERLGLEGLCFTYTKPNDIAQFQKFTKLKLSSAILCNPNDVRKYKGKHLTIVKAPEDQTKLRSIIEQVCPDILYGLELSHRSDFIHHRASGLNHIMAQLAKDKGVTIGFSFSDILTADPKRRSVIIGRMRQNLRFARKFKFNMVIASFTDKPVKLRSGTDLFSFFVALGAPKTNLGLRY